MKKLPVILVVDDEPIIPQTCKAVMGRDFQILAASNGIQALGMLAKAAVELVFLDINMPAMGGIEILRKIKEQDRDLPVILLTGAENPQTTAEAERLGIDGYLAKPFDARGIIALAQQTIKKKRDIYREDSVSKK